MSDSYVVREIIAEGAHAVVWRGEYRGSDAAIKLPRHPIDEPRLTRELALLRRIDHPHVMCSQSATALVMPLGACSLADLAAARTLGTTEVVAVIRATDEALRAVHRAGLAHNDIKASNVVLDEHGHPWLADLGSATRAIPALVQRDRDALLRLAMELLPASSRSLRRRVGRAASVAEAFAGEAAVWPAVGTVARASVLGDVTEDFGDAPADQRLTNRPSRFKWLDRFNARVRRLAREGSASALMYARRSRHGSTRNVAKAMEPKRSPDR